MTFYIIIKNSNKNKKENINEEIIIEDLNEKYFKIKDCLARSGNVVQEYDSQKEIIKILFSFFNARQSEI